MIQRLNVLIRKIADGSATNADKGELQDLQKERVRLMTPSIVQMSAFPIDQQAR